MHNENQLTEFEKKLGSRLTNEQAIEEIANRLNQKLDSLYPEAKSSNATIHGYSLGGLFAHTFRFVLAYNGKSVDIFAKICPMYENLNPAKMEFDTLKLVYEKMQTTSNIYAVSRPLAYFEDMSCYAMESVGVCDLRSFYLKNNSVFAKSETVEALRQYIRGSAEWLSLFHSSTASNKSERFNIKTFIEGFDEEFSYRNLSGFSFKSPVLALIDKAFGRLSDGAINFSMPLAGWHWDFTPGHVYLDNNKISVIDILGMSNTPIYEDIGHFLASITSINNLPKYPFFDRNRSATDFCNAFIEAYQKKSAIPHAEFMLLTNIYRLKHLIIYFLIQNRRISDKLGRFAGTVYSNYRAVPVFEKPILDCLSHINRYLDM